jgi:O-antigen ligase
VSVAAPSFGLRAPRPARAVTPSGGSLTWIAAAFVGTASLAAAAFTGDGALFWAAAGATLLATIFALRADVGLILIVLARPSLDVWASESIASASGWVRLNIASLLALTLIVVGGAFVIERWEYLRDSPALPPFLVFAGIAGLSVAVGPLNGAGIYEWLRLVSLLVLYACSYAVVRLLGDARPFALAILASAALPIAVALYQVSEGALRAIADFDRATGTFLHPVPFGIFLGLVIVFAAPLLLCRDLGWRWALRIIAPLAFIALVVTYTRTAWIGLAVGLLVVAVARHRLLLVVTPLAAVAIAVAIPETVERSTNLESQAAVPSEAGNSVDSRFEQWRVNLPKVQRNPLSGQGLGSIAESQQGVRVHSDYVRAAVETGVFGLLAYLWLLIATVRGSWRSLRAAVKSADRIASAIALGSFGAAAAFIVMSTTSNLMTQVVVASAFWSIMAVGHAAARAEAELR